MEASLPIPVTAVLDYARAYEFDEEQTCDLVYFIRKMDREFLDFEAKQQKRNRKIKRTL